MPFDAVILFLFSLAASALLVGAGQYLKSRFLTPYLDTYFLFLLVTAVYGLINWTGPYIALAIIGGAPAGESMVTIVLFVLFAVPFLLVKIGLFLTLLLALRNKKLPDRLLQAILIASAIAVIATVIAVKAYFDTREIASLRFFVIGFGLSAIIVELSALIHFVAATRGGKSAIGNSAAIWGGAYLAGHIIYVAVSYGASLGAPAITQSTAPYIYFLLHMPPLAIIARHLRTSGKPRLAGDGAQFADRFGLTKREVEILHAVTSGRSNAEIGEALFISPNTVKNHIYSIYQKTGVKNRIQLASILTEEAESANGAGQRAQNEKLIDAVIEDYAPVIKHGDNASSLSDDPDK